MARVKICGVRDEHMVRTVARAGADWVGFVLAPKSPRYIVRHGEPLSERLIDLLTVAAEADIRSAVLVVNPEIEWLHGLTNAVLPDVIQLHGNETPAFVAELREAVPRNTEIWKAVGVAGPSDLEAASAHTAADRLLIDARPPEGADRTGGHGQTFDWSILETWHAPKPWLLAGGLTPDNVADAIQRTQADAVDVSSGVERVQGEKDVGLVRAFIEAARGAAANA
ncbi:phosphoribosylanthranilate isomerase [Henriciella sp.]|uniref:phosphoribosylanthranilate isomerase n=1 Tax=Henriciella sp. TaxID=1968823 RepID=UPI0026203558|nr:phosphoribosylanthranilate isomerase [Henriciella sp.]